MITQGTGTAEVEEGLCFTYHHLSHIHHIIPQMCHLACQPASQPTEYGGRIVQFNAKIANAWRHAFPL